MKKLCMVLVIAMVVALALSGCGGGGSSSNPKSDDSDSNSEKEVFKVGMITLGTETAMFKAMTMNEETIAEAAGIEIVKIELAGYDDESIMTAYESLINQGVDAVSLFTVSETVLPLLKEKFEESNVKFFLFNRKISTPELEEQLLSSPMCIGNDHAEETQNAYDMVKKMKTDYDIKNLAVIGLTQGDINGGYRDAGIEQACEELGINLITETRGIVTTEDVTKSMDGIIASYPEIDSVFIVGGLITNGALAGVYQSLVNSKLDDKVVIGMVDISTGMQEYMDEGPLKLVAGGNLIADDIFSLVAIANDLHGTPLGEKPIIIEKMFWIESAEDAANYDKYIEGTVPPFSTEDYQQTMFKWINQDVSLESVQQVANDFSIQSVIERNKDKF